MTEPRPYEGIVVLGAPRSGTTLVRRLLNAHPNISCPPETNLLRAAGRFLHEDPSGAPFGIGVVPGLAFSDYRESVVMERFREFLFSFHREIAQRAGKSRWAEKTAFDAFHVDNIERLLGDTCRFVCMFRHGLDVVCSIKELCDGMDRYLVELHEYVRVHSSPYEAFAHAWVDCSSRLLKLIADHPDLCVPLRYEDLLDDAPAHLARVLDFLDEPTDVDALIRAAFAQGAEVGLGDWKTYETKGFDQGRVGRWRDLTDVIVARLAPIVNPTMRAIGYDAVEGETAPPSEDAIRQYRATYMVRQMLAAKSHDKD